MFLTQNNGTESKDTGAKSSTEDDMPEVTKKYNRLLKEKPITTTPPNFRVNEREFRNVQTKIDKLEELGVLAAYENALCGSQKRPLTERSPRIYCKRN